MADNYTPSDDLKDFITAHAKKKAEDAAKSNPAGAQSPVAGPRQFVAVDEGIPSDFVLIPAGIQTFIPWWGWVTLAVIVVGMFIGIAVFPSFEAKRLVSKLSSTDQQALTRVMRDLINSPTGEVEDHLYKLAASPSQERAARFNAVETLSLKPGTQAEEALYKLKNSPGIDSSIRKAAGYALEQRRASPKR